MNIYVWRKHARMSFNKTLAGEIFKKGFLIAKSAKRSEASRQKLKL